MIKILKKFEGRSLDELRVRGAQALAARVERYGLSEQTRVPGDDALFKKLDAGWMEGRASVSAETLLAHFRTRRAPVFFAAFGEREATLEELRRRFDSQAREAVIEKARRIAEGRFDLLGFSNLSFGNPIDWHLEPVARVRTPRTHWSRINYLDAGVAGDKKIVWELNRQQYFSALGRAYWYTKDEQYAQTFVAHLEHWMEQNPPKLGINWASSLEVAFRAISWLWALYFFKDSPHLTPPVFLRALKFLYLHARHLETYLSTYFSPNTHLTGEALGLFYLGTLLPEFSAALGWRETGQRILLAQLESHGRPDGVYFEQSSYYHRYTTDFYTHLLILARLNGKLEAGRPDGDKLAARLAALLDHLMHITRPDGTSPLFGDDDGGKLSKLDERAANDFRATLSTGAALFRRADYKYVAGAELSEETLWLLGASGAQVFDQLDARPPSEASRAFPDGGYYVMRDSWSSDANYLLIDCGPHGMKNCGHAHADTLSFELAARGRTMLVDPGTYTYTGSDELRDLFRSSTAHNTLTIDGQSSSIPAGTFQWRRIAESTPRKWTTHARFDYFEGAHDGYARLDSPATHTRSILFLKEGYWVMRDTVETSGTHTYDAYFHFAPGSDPTIEREGEMMLMRENGAHMAGLEIFAPSGDGVWKKADGWVSEQYGQRAPAPVCTRSTQAEGKRDFTTFLVPASAEQRDFKRRIFEISAVGGRAFIHDGSAPLSAASSHSVRDLLLVGDGRHQVSTTNFVSDFKWTWARFAGDGTEPEELVLIEGRQLEINGKKIVCARTKERIAHLWARSVDGEWQFETDAEVDFTPAARRARQMAGNV